MRSDPAKFGPVAGSSNGRTGKSVSLCPQHHSFSFRHFIKIAPSFSVALALPG